MTVNQTTRGISATEAVTLTLRTGLEHHHRGQLSEAAALYSEVQGMDPGNVHALFLLGLVALAARNEDAAERLLSAALTRRPEAAHVHRALAEVMRRTGRYGAAFASCWRALRLDPRNAQLYLDLASILVEMKAGSGNDGLAERCLRRAMELEGQSAAAHGAMGHLHLRAGKPGEAEAAFRFAVSLDAANAKYRSGLGMSLHRQGRYMAAADAYRSAIQLAPGWAAAYLNLGDALRALKQMERAEESYRRALVLRPHSATAWTSVGELLHTKGDLQGALECYQQALAVRPSAQLWRRTAHAHQALGAMDEALHAAGQARALLPRSPAAKRRTQPLQVEKMVMFGERRVSGPLQAVPLQ